MRDRVFHLILGKSLMDPKQNYGSKMIVYFKRYGDLEKIQGQIKKAYKENPSNKVLVPLIKAFQGELKKVFTQGQQQKVFSVFGGSIALLSSNTLSAPSINSFFHLLTWIGWTPYWLASCPKVFSSLKASRATFFLKAAVRGVFFIFCLHAQWFS